MRKFQIIFVTLRSKKNYMIELRVKECCKAHNILMSELASKMGYEQVTSLNQLLRRRKIGLDKLEQMANIIGCKITELFEEGNEADFVAFVRFNGEYFTADTLDALIKYIEKIKTI